MLSDFRPLRHPTIRPEALGLDSRQQPAARTKHRYADDVLLQLKPWAAAALAGGLDALTSRG